MERRPFMLSRSTLDPYHGVDLPILRIEKKKTSGGTGSEYPLRPLTEMNCEGQLFNW